MNCIEIGYKARAGGALNAPCGYPDLSPCAGAGEDAARSSVLLVQGTANGCLTLKPDGSFFYSPDVGFVGTDRFTYRVSDLDEENNRMASVSILVE
ncbi:Ig-like domain-containing protein [Coraliomargarita parva]|uniref:Ig-like domain-containing protein n=1 Tax=Coraliomargarita parva TaxID=3014050 RepID=UPI0022B3A43B|nr:Ig-like domain-containing protein [Coraliomargarita parva]